MSKFKFQSTVTLNDEDKLRSLTINCNDITYKSNGDAFVFSAPGEEVIVPMPSILYMSTSRNKDYEADLSGEEDT